MRLVEQVQSDLAHLVDANPETMSYDRLQVELLLDIRELFGRMLEQFTHVPTTLQVHELIFPRGDTADPYYRPPDTVAR